MKKACLVKLYTTEQFEYDYNEILAKAIGNSGFEEVSDENFYFLQNNLNWLNKQDIDYKYVLVEYLPKEEIPIKLDEIKKYIAVEQAKQQRIKDEKKQKE